MNVESESRGAYARFLGSDWWLLLIGGILLIIIGLVAISVPLATALAIELLLGWILVVGGIVHGVYAFKSRHEPGVLLRVVTAILYLAAGIILLAHPLAGVLTLTLLLAILFTVEGVSKIITAFGLRAMPNWGWVMFNGIVTLILGVIMWANWPIGAAWVIGLLVGIDLLVAGWVLVMVAFAARAAARAMHMRLAGGHA